MHNELRQAWEEKYNMISLHVEYFLKVERTMASRSQMFWGLVRCLSNKTYII